LLIAAACAAPPRTTLETDTYRRLRAALDAVPAIDTHDHLKPFPQLPIRHDTERGRGANLAGIWRSSYFSWNSPLPPWPENRSFPEWWAKAKPVFADGRAMSFYRYMLPAWQDLYGVDFDRVTDAEAARLDARIFENYRDEKWLHHVITERANIELMINDPFWGRLEFAPHYPFEVQTLNVTSLVRGFHPSEFMDIGDDPYRFAKTQGMKVESLDDYLAVLDRLLAFAKERGAVCLKSTLAYQRTLRFENVPQKQAAKAFGRPKTDLTPAEIAAFEDFIQWRLAALAAKHDLPFQIHTGQARVQGSNPILLVDLIEANPKTKFILFHGGYPWVGEVAVIVMRHTSHVWVDSCWMPTLSYTMAKRAYHEWLDAMPSSRILWGADMSHAEGIYGATVMTRRCLAEVLAERVERGELTEPDALRIGRQILRDNALALFPTLKERLWKDKKRR
jgi:predicted TIM-barrel fold metal-dependent hydrolase